MADLAVWQRTIVDEEGNIVPGAEVEVRREEDDSLATLYADRAGETPLANPLAADMSGFVRFFAQGDAYTITAVGAGSTRTWRFDPTGRLQEFDRVSEALVADDAADLLAARANLGTFSSVADVQNSHIPVVLESIRTLGRNAPGDGGGALLVEGTSSDPEAVQDADGKWWRIAEKVVRPQMFGAKGDGTTDDQAAVEAAVNFALLTGEEIHWPDGAYVSSGNIPGFHSVRHRGPGAIRRGADIFRVDPQEVEGHVNRIYVAPDGTGDGLSPETATSLSQVRPILRRYANPGLGGRWEIVLTAGTYTDRVNLRSLTISAFPLIFRGPDVGGHPNEPTAIIDMQNANLDACHIAHGSWVEFYDIKIINCAARGWVSSQKSRVSLYNCHSYNVFNPVLYMDNSHIRVSGGVYDGNNINNSVGIRGYYGCSHQIGNNSTVDAPLLKNFRTGLQIGEGCFGHLDYTRVHDCERGVYFNRVDSGANTSRMQIYRCDIGVLCRNSSWMNNFIDFGTGTPNACGTNVKLLGDSPEHYFRTSHYESRTSRQQAQTTGSITHTGTTSATTIWSPFVIPQGFVMEAGDTIEVEMSGTASLVNGFAQLSIGFGDGSLGSVSIPNGTERWSVKIVGVWTTGSNFRVSYTSWSTPDDKTRHGYSAGTVDTTTGALPFEVRANLSNADDGVTVQIGVVKTTIGG